MHLTDYPGQKQELRASSFGYRLSILFRMFRFSTLEEMTDLGLKPWLIPFLAELFHGDGVPQEELAERLFVDKGRTARALARLELEGLVFRVKNRENRRQKLVYLTDKALLIEGRFFAVLQKSTRRMTRGLSPAEQETALRLFERMIENCRIDTTRDDQ